MRVLFATSPHVRHPAVLQSDFAPNNAVMYSFAPIGLLSLAAAVRRSVIGAECVLYDLNRRITTGSVPLGPGLYDVIAEDLRAHKPDVVGFMTECDSYHHVIQICAALKKLLPDCCIILGGPHASAVAHPTMKTVTAVDAIVIGEGEVSFPELLVSLKSDAAVAGTLRRVSGERLLQGPPRSLVETLDELPIPAFDLYAPDAGEEMFIEVGRGCPFQCEFCSTAPYWHRRHRVKSPDRILRELRIVQHSFGTERIHFTHDLFTTNKVWVKALCEALIEEGSPATWTCSARADTVDENLLILMKKAGCGAIYFGLESGSQRILREIKKDIPISRSLEVISICKRIGISPNAGLIVGFPTEDNASLRDTFAVYERVLKLGCRPAHIFAFCPFADAPLFPRLRDLVCSGHFVDLPMGPDTDIRNRNIVASDQMLYGAYFRPDLPELVPGEPLALSALDEFSSLVDAAMVPALRLADIRGGMYDVFCGWLSWIQHHNKERRAQSYRAGYGTAAMFARYLLDELTRDPRASKSDIAIAVAIETNLRVAESVNFVSATTMASHRSFSLPNVEGPYDFTLNTRLARGTVIETLSLSFDVTPVFVDRVDDDISEEPTYLAWQIIDPRSVRLIKIDRAIFDALEQVRDKSATVGELLMANFEGMATSSVPSSMIASLENATHEGLLAVETV